MKYINAEALMSWISAQKLLTALDHGDEAVFDTYTKVQRKIASSGSVEVKHGEWINPEMGYEDCSVCGYCFAVYDEHDHYIERNFCPHCGADMRERKETE